MQLVRNENMEMLEKDAKEANLFFNPDTVMVGIIDKIEITDHETKDKVKYKKVKLTVKASNGKTYTKSWSTDFARKYFTQVGIKAKDIRGINCAMTQGNYKQIAFFAFMGYENKGEEIELKLLPYEEDTTELEKMFESLGI